MNKKKNEEDIVNYRLEKINKIKKKPVRKGFYKFFDDKNNSMNVSNIDNGSMSSKIFNKSVNKKNVTLRMLDFEQNYDNQLNIQQSEELNSRIRYLSFLIFIITFLIYKRSLFNCSNINECIKKYNVNVVLNCLTKSILSGLFLSFNVAFIIWKLLSKAHILIILIFIIGLLFIDYGNDIYNHGLINFSIMFISTIFGTLFLLVFQTIRSSFIEKNYRVAIYLISWIFIIFISFYIFYYLVLNCSYWNKGLNGVQIDNNKNKYSCKIRSPSKCYISAFDNVFDFSKMLDYKCDSQNMKFTFLETLENYSLYYDAEFEDNVSVLNFPLTNNEQYSGFEFNNENNFGRKVITNIKGDSKKDIQNSEIFLIKDGKYSTIEMNMNKNHTLIRERKKKENASSKIKNIIFIYFDSLSRQQFLRQLQTFSNILSDLYDSSNTNYESLEFLKYHTFNNYNHQSLNSLFYGTSILHNEYNNEDEKPMHILSHLKNNGFITAQSANICSKHLSGSYFNSFKDEFDHENIAMFCDPNYSIVDPKKKYIKGIHSSLKRCLFGRDTFEYVFDYGKMFWETYSENNKFLRLGFFDGNENSGEVVKYLDNYLVDFLLDIINKGKFLNTMLFLVSSSGEIEAGIFDKKRKSEFFYEKNLGSWFMIINKYGLDKKIIENIKKNMQNFVTPYDVYDTLLSIIYDCYDINCTEKIKHRSINGISAFNSINGFERNCEKYKEISENGCHCKKY